MITITLPVNPLTLPTIRRSLCLVVLVTTHSSFRPMTALASDGLIWQGVIADLGLAILSFCHLEIVKILSDVLFVHMRLGKLFSNALMPFTVCCI